MTHLEIGLFIITLVLGFYASFSIGGNDVANAIGTSVGSKALSLKKAIFLAAIFEFVGIYFFGSYVSKTIQTGIVDPVVFENTPLSFALGMLSSLLATGLWLQFASYYGLPVSTTHTIVGSVLGFGLVVGGVHSIQWYTVLYISLSWIFTPLFSALISFALFSFIRNFIFFSPCPITQSKKIMPWMVGFSVFVLSLCLSLSFKMDIHNLQTLFPCIFLAILSGLFFTLFASFFAYKKPKKKRRKKLPLETLQLFQQAREKLQKLSEKLSGDASFRIHSILREVDTLFFGVRTDVFEQHKGAEWEAVEKIFATLQVFSLCLIAFAHGSNDVANAIGPMAAAIHYIQDPQHLIEQESFPQWALLIGAGGILIGLVTWGWRVIATIAEGITTLTPSRGFSAEISTALVIILASYAGFPVSATHTLVGAILGVGFAGGLGSINIKTIRDIALSWAITIPVGACLTLICFFILSSCIQLLQS